MGSNSKINIAFAGLVFSVGGFLAGVTVTDDAGETSELVLSQEDIQRVGRDYAEARRKQAQYEGRSWEQQSWLIERRLFESIISLREFRNANPAPDPDPVDPPVDPPVEPTPDPDPPIETHTAFMPGDAAVGDVSTIGRVKQGEKYVVYASARMVAGYRAVLHVQDTETWEVVAGDSWDGAGDEVGDYHLTVWAELEAGKRYRAEVWTTRTLEDGSTASGQKKQVFIEP